MSTFMLIRLNFQQEILGHTGTESWTQTLFLLCLCHHTHTFFLLVTPPPPPSTSLYIPLSVWQDPSGIRGDLIWSPALASFRPVRKPFYIGTLKERHAASGVCCNGWRKRLIGRRVEDALSSSSHHCSRFSITPPPHPACPWLTCMWMRKRGRRGLRARDKEAIWTVH